MCSLKTGFRSCNNKVLLEIIRWLKFAIAILGGKNINPDKYLISAIILERRRFPGRATLTELYFHFLNAKLWRIKKIIGDYELQLRSEQTAAVACTLSC